MFQIISIFSITPRVLTPFLYFCLIDILLNFILLYEVNLLLELSNIELFWKLIKNGK